ncbi:MAG: Asp-tRNA(Asn)/Glu-tRNA(Gln) amidotransferase subunit GatA [Flavobacteriales bacterium]|jgi:aspartyl-tRNA(Asn)/glutamyl-tRNA(Gln) amidotransferase subunit A|nr:Asp-tRNA(Asn)/Glu-tRNA(Gln) amidotransferase subunit GatA [Flavobacteriales bacterium]MBK6755059.1 Asp-tRNA(Asn)/Glu-tRNA(Gln) amidotransferase subunit GatA [Flavobacteriales bacterium]MBK7085593.1 Asp-tRNA(Asn)/Glu-tRNA(Gln) amidotransferase subunit GatA [Flavobacteriales bacterium]MBK7268110.1 Asp-tRNA(Asn)/Glu-tRNA(Gln) amidotransferase subunit GatA [Flavobacteriales bacterium]MBK7751238.1 Asp-tRNA(Asn)/Glu-tRNA(Gln) amidotransferase subunit GatA [Flavobacteriales bacterium]
MNTPRTFREAKDLLTSASTSITALTERALADARSKQDLNAFLELFDESALAQAAHVDARMKGGDAGPLAGLVLSIKDNICYKDHRVGASSRILEGFTSLYSSTVVERLLAADAVILGRTNCDEFAMGSSNENSAYGPVLNPLDPSRVPGGSSGGAAASVAAGIVHAALGSDTGGSIRQPASFTGTVGFKPTYGRVSRYGLIAFASSFDQIGPFAHSVDDATAVYNAIAGPDRHDSTTSQRPAPPIALDHPGKLRIAYYKECVERPGVAPAVREAMTALVDRLKKGGHTVEPADLPMLDHQVPTYYIIATAEASSNLARFDGIHYGHRSARAKGVEETYRFSRSEGFGPEVQRRILLGTFVLSAGYYDAYYGQAQRVRRLIREATLRTLSDHDLILLPTSPMTAFERGALSEDPIAMYLQDIFTVQANLAGVPAISVPLGTDTAGLPFGAQLMAAPFAEEVLLRAAKHLF